MEKKTIFYFLLFQFSGKRKSLIKSNLLKENLIKKIPILNLFHSVHSVHKDIQTIFYGNKNV